jgi:hypothetical protein
VASRTPIPIPLRTPKLDKPEYAARKTLHIVSTKILEGNEVLVGYSDGSGAIFEADELEKLRPKPKRTFPNVQAIDDPGLRATA